MRLIVVCPYLPHRDIGHGGGISTYNLIRYLAREHQVTVLTFLRSNEEQARTDLPAQGVRLEAVPFSSNVDRGVDRARLVADRGFRWWKAQLSGRPFMVQKYDRPSVRRRLSELIRELDPQGILAEYTFMAPYLLHARRLREGLGQSRPRLVLNTHEAAVLPRRRRLEVAASPWARWRARRDLSQWTRYEAAAVTWPDVAMCVTDQDRQILSSIGNGGNLVTVPLGIDTDGLTQVSGSATNAPPRLLFVGSFEHLPNREAAELLVREIFPQVRAAMGDARLDIVGRHPPAAVAEAAEADDAIAVHGFVPDLDPFFEQASLFVAPLFSGGGIKIKILEAMGRGIPVLTTPIGIEGIGVQPGVEVAVAKDASAVVAEAVDLLENDDARTILGARGRDAIHRRYGWSTIARVVAQHLSG